MLTRAHKTAIAAATGQSEPHTSIPMTARSQARVPKGRGNGLGGNGVMGSGRVAVQAAAVRSMPGNPDVDLTTAQASNQMAIYEDVEAAQGSSQSPNLSGNGAQLRPKMTLEIPIYKPGTTDEEGSTTGGNWPRYQQRLEFYMESVFPGTVFDLNSQTKTYTLEQDKQLYYIICHGVTNKQWRTLEARCKGRGAEGFRILDKQVRGDIYKRKAQVQYEREHLWFTEEMDVDTYSIKLHKLYNDLIELGVETEERCALNLLLTQVNRLPERFEYFADKRQRMYIGWEEAEQPTIEDFVDELSSEESIIRLRRLERSRAPTVHAAVANTQGGGPANTTTATTPVAIPPTVQATNTLTQAQRPPPGPGAQGRGRTNYNGSAKRREWQRPYPKKNYNSKSTYNSNYNSDYNSNTRSNGYYPDNYHSYGKPTCSKCGKSGRGHTAYECWQPDCTRCKTSAHTLAYCPKA